MPNNLNSLQMPRGVSGRNFTVLIDLVVLKHLQNFAALRAASALLHHKNACGIIRWTGRPQQVMITYMR